MDIGILKFDILLSADALIHASETVFRKFLCKNQAFRFSSLEMAQSDWIPNKWAMIEDYFMPSDKHGCKPTHKKKVIVDAILYVVKSGCQWRMLPKDFPSWNTVYGHFSRWNKQGLWEHALDKLNGLYRERKNRHAKPSYGIIDSQSVKTICVSEERGVDGRKKWRVESAILSWIFWTIYCTYRYTPPIPTIPRLGQLYLSAWQRNTPSSRHFLAKPVTGEPQ